MHHVQLDCMGTCWRTTSNGTYACPLSTVVVVNVVGHQGRTAGDNASDCRGKHNPAHLYSMNKLKAAEGPFQSPTTRSMLVSELEAPWRGGRMYVRQIPAHNTIHGMPGWSAIRMGACNAHSQEEEVMAQESGRRGCDTTALLQLPLR